MDVLAEIDGGSGYNEWRLWLRLMDVLVEIGGGSG